LSTFTVNRLDKTFLKDGIIQDAVYVQQLLGYKLFHIGRTGHRGAVHYYGISNNYLFDDNCKETLT
jgi:hypothetical protein